MELKTMREVMAATGITESALRYYNDKGVLAPAVQEQSGRKRWLYSGDDIRKVKLIQLMKYIGISVDDMKTALENEDSFRQVIEASIQTLKEERDRLEKRVAAAGMLAFDAGLDIVTSGGDLDDATAASINDALRERQK